MSRPLAQAEMEFIQRRSSSHSYRMVHCAQTGKGALRHWPVPEEQATPSWGQQAVLWHQLLQRAPWTGAECGLRRRPSDVPGACCAIIVPPGLPFVIGRMVELVLRKMGLSLGSPVHMCGDKPTANVQLWMN
jgi:hypothetical protein